jgi:drug/metabolite transporter (DMT)-like permease
VKPYIAAFLSSCLFGLSFTFSRSALQHVDAMQMLAFRFVIAAALMHILRAMGVIKVELRLKQMGPLLVMGVIQPVLYFIFETVGIALTSASEASIVVALIPVFTVFFAIFFLKERPTALRLTFAAVSVSGVILIALVEALGKTSGNLLGLLILLGAPICAACFTVLSRYFSVRYRPAEITFVMMNLSAVVFTTLAIAEQAYKGQLSTFFAPLTLPPVWMAILYLGVGSSVGAFFLTNYTLSKIEASQMSVFNNLTTLIAVVAAVVILREPLHWYHVVGGALIITGVWGMTTAAAKQKGR